MILLLNIYGVFVSFHPKIVEYHIALKGKHNWHGQKIVMIADTHYGNIYHQKHAKSLVDTINSIDPRIVLVPGDFFDGPVIDFESVASEFRHIKAPFGVLFCNGNHEEYHHTDTMLSALKKANIVILNNKKQTFDGIDFIGVTYNDTDTVDGLNHVLQDIGINTHVPNILLKHKPTFHSIIQDYGIDLVVSGHSHNGQMLPLSFLAWVAYGKYAHGIQKDTTLTSITTSGVGSWGPPQRIGTKSEIVVIHID